MLSNKMVDLLNKQINLEFYSSNLYLQMSAWCEYKALESCAEFLRLHAEEEMTHMNRLFKYVADTGASFFKIDSCRFNLLISSRSERVLIPLSLRNPSACRFKA